MNHNLLRTTLFAASLGLAPLAFAQGTAFTWQGRLTDTGQPANGRYDLSFVLYDAAGGGTALGSTNLLGAAVFNGDVRWLQLALRTNGAAPGRPARSGL